MTDPILIISREDLLSKMDEISNTYFNIDQDTAKGKATKEIFDTMIGELDGENSIIIKGTELTIMKPEGHNHSGEIQNILAELKIECKSNY